MKKAKVKLPDGMAEHMNRKIAQLLARQEGIEIIYKMNGKRYSTEDYIEPWSSKKAKKNSGTNH